MRVETYTIKVFHSTGHLIECGYPSVSSYPDLWWSLGVSALVSLHVFEFSYKDITSVESCSFMYKHQTFSLVTPVCDAM